MSKKLWGGRFAKPTDPVIEEFTKSIHYDKKLARYDAIGSIAHVQVLKKAGYLTALEAAKLTGALGQIYKACVKGTIRFDASAEDVHTDIQNKLRSKVGDLVLKLHTARSRNDQVLFATKLYCKMELAKLLADISVLKASLKSLAAKHRDLVVPGFTHMQHAQPVRVSDYLGAYGDMLTRDAARLSGVAGGIQLTMGSGALAGTPIDAAKYSISISGIKVTAPSNSIDAVSDRDFVVEILSGLAIMGMHLSRMAEDIIIWSSKEFSFIDLDESVCTGSSLMPQKKNADPVELVRGSAGKLYGNLLSLLTTMKGLPLSYNRDMQLDKEPLFASVETAILELKVMSAVVKNMNFNRTRIESHLEDESLYATDLVYYLVSKGVAFKSAHTIVGRLVRYSLENNIEIKSMTDTELKRFSDKLSSKEIVKLFNPKVSVESKRSIRRK